MVKSGERPDVREEISVVQLLHCLGEWVALSSLPQYGLLEHGKKNGKAAHFLLYLNQKILGFVKIKIMHVCSRKFRNCFLKGPPSAPQPRDNPCQYVLPPSPSCVRIILYESIGDRKLGMKFCILFFLCILVSIDVSVSISI